LSPDNVHQKLDDKHKQYKGNVDSNVGGAVEKEAAAKGFNADYIRKDVEATGEINKNRFDHLNNKVNDKYDSTRDATQTHYDQMQQVIEQNEKDRIGRGVIGSSVASVLGTVTGGYAGENIGRPREEMIPLTNSGKNESTVSSDLDDILPRYKQYTGEEPAPHDIDKGSGRVQEEAAKTIKNALNSGITNIDIGIAQINYRWHGDNFKNIEKMINPATNIEYAAKLLSSLFKQHKTWHKAIRHYHSANPDHHRRYSRKVVIAWLGNNQLIK
jgi:uncharacterized protein YcfJ